MVKVLIIKAFVLLFLTHQSNLTSPCDDVLIWNDTVYHFYPSIKNIETYCEDTCLPIDVTTFKSDGDYKKIMLILEIKNDSLYYVSTNNCAIDNACDSLIKSVLEQGTKVWMGNFSGTFFCGYGKGSCKYGFPYLLYDREITMCIENGICKKHTVNTSVESKYGELDTLTDFVYSNLNLDNIDTSYLDDSVKTYVRYDVDSTGNLRNIKVIKSSGNESFDQEVVRVVSLIPLVSISYFKGEFFPKMSVIPVSYKKWKDFKNQKK